MLRKALLLLSIMSLSACLQTEPEVRYGADGRPLPSVYKIKKGDVEEIPLRVLESVNALRQARGTAPLVLSPQLTAAAAAHSRDMSAQNRAWHFGSDGSSPIDRVRRQGYMAGNIGQNISETYETETETLSAWMGVSDTRDVILNPAARDLGFAWHQESSGKIWWTMITGG